MCLLSPLGASPSRPHASSWSQVLLDLCPHAGPALFSVLSHLFFWNVLPDSAPPLRLLLSVLKYQSLPYEVRRATPAGSVRQGNIGISSVFGVRISLFSSLSAGPSQINSRWELTAHSFRTHSFQKSSLQWSTPSETPAVFVAQVLPLASW